MKTEISFVIPIYNKKIKQVENCVQSIKKINGITYEIILIDDGSTKINGQAYRELAKNNSCRYYYQTNNGVSSARNLGIRQAIGSYLFFVDADDLIDASKLNLVDVQKLDDMVIFDVTIHYKNGEEELFNLNHLDVHPNKKELLEALLQNGIMNWSVAKLYSRSFLIENNLFFNESIYSGEDLDFITRVVNFNTVVTYIPSSVYIYLIDENTGKFRALKYPLESLNDELMIYKNRLNILNELNIKDSSTLTENTIKAMFEVYLILSKYSLKDAKKYNAIFIKKIDEISKNTESLSTFVKIKIYLIKNRDYLLINIYSVLRSIYKKVFGKNNLI